MPGEQGVGLFAFSGRGGGVADREAALQAGGAGVFCVRPVVRFVVEGASKVSAGVSR
ncbi:hypothetical protein GCM10009549_41090 [Streptomyces thermoalcalitolerans]|uniref:Uncharacterized protein n=1 Tax=Streptomyces thermoalcalitolerans TaxID=65605 RepID=A0ABP3ZJJ7_9ACTN